MDAQLGRQFNLTVEDLKRGSVVPLGFTLVSTGWAIPTISALKIDANSSFSFDARTKCIRV
jgi:hypothetical protein